MPLCAQFASHTVGGLWFLLLQFNSISASLCLSIQAVSSFQFFQTEESNAHEIQSMLRSLSLLALFRIGLATRNVLLCFDRGNVLLCSVVHWPIFWAHSFYPLDTTQSCCVVGSKKALSQRTVPIHREHQLMIDELPFKTRDNFHSVLSKPIKRKLQ